jgi:hypothetical protein
VIDAKIIPNVQNLFTFDHQFHFSSESLKLSIIYYASHHFPVRKIYYVNLCIELTTQKPKNYF